MKETLIINNFAGLKEIRLDLSNINVLIGPQATGKSIIAKCLFYFKSFITELFNAAESDKSKRDLDIDFKRKFEEYFPTVNTHEQDFVIRYEIADTFIQIEKSKSSIKLDYSDYYKKEFRTLKTQIVNSIDKFKNRRKPQEIGDPFDVSFDRFRIVFEIKNEFLKKQSNKLGRNAGFSQFFIPAGRSFFLYYKVVYFRFSQAIKLLTHF